MSGALFYVDALPAVGHSVAVTGDEGFHAASVRRIRPGERLLVSDGAGEMACCEVNEVSRAELRAAVLTRWFVPAPVPAVCIVQALPKADRSELAVELATEAGADTFVAWQAARCVARWDGARADKGLRRWRAVVRSAARQSRRARVPSVSGPLTTDELTRRIAEDTAAGTAVLALHESATTGIAEVLTEPVDSIVMLVGPEGGISDTELATLVDAGAIPVRLGPAVLRTSSAGAVALGALGVLTPRWRDAGR